MQDMKRSAQYDEQNDKLRQSPQAIKSTVANMVQSASTASTVSCATIFVEGFCQLLSANLLTVHLGFIESRVFGVEDSHEGRPHFTKLLPGFTSTFESDAMRFNAMQCSTVAPRMPLDQGSISE